MPTTLAGPRPATGRKTEYYKPGDAARRLAGGVQVGTGKKAAQKRRGDDKREPGQDFEPRRLRAPIALLKSSVLCSRKTFQQNPSLHPWSKLPLAI